jgi:hypothetical protein
LDKNKSDSSDDADDEDRGFSLDSGNLVIGVQIMPGTIPRWKVFIRFKDGIGPALTGQLLTLMTPVTMVGNLVVSGVTSVASGVSSVVSNTAGWIWGGSSDKNEQTTAKIDSANKTAVMRISPANIDSNTSENAINTKEPTPPHTSHHMEVDIVNAKNTETSQSVVPSDADTKKQVTVEQDNDSKGSGWGLASSADWALSFFIKKKGNKKKTDDDEDEHDEDDVHDKNSVKSVYSLWIPIYGTLYYTISTPKEGKDQKYSYEELSYELDSVKHQATLEKLLSDKILIEEKAALVVYLLVDGLTKVPFAATISKKIAGFILSNLGKNVRSAYNWIADSENKPDRDKSEREDKKD